MAFFIVYMVKMKNLNFARTLFLRKQPLNVLKTVFQELTSQSWLFLVMVLLNVGMGETKIVKKIN